MNDSIIGAKVIHSSPSLGSGQIVGLKSGYIEVHFNGKSAGVTSKFVFPDIFFDERGLLKAVDERLAKAIQDEYEYHICDRCGHYFPKVTRVRHRKYCELCKETLITCRTCKRLFEPSECFDTGTYDRWYQCKKCYAETHVECAMCGKVVDIDNTTTSKYLANGKPICYYCLEREHTQCRCCDIWGSDDDFKYIDGSPVCEDCEITATFTCKVCGKQFLKATEKSDQLCIWCKRKQDYREYTRTLDFSKLRCESILFYDLKNRPSGHLMSRLRHCYEKSVPQREDDKSFDVLFVESFRCRFVFMWDYPGDFKSLSEYGTTMTDLKRRGMYYLLNGRTCEVEEVVQVGEKEFFHIWKRPYEIRAVTDADKDYGKHWYGRYYCEEHNEFGDTSTFGILGYVTSTPDPKRVPFDIPYF